MFTTILLLDCPETMKSRLEALGYDVKVGTSGHLSGLRSLPCPIYECNLVIYNPTREPVKANISAKEQPTDTPVIDFSRETIIKHVTDGGHWLVFVNQISKIQDIQQFVYSFVPGVPQLYFTQDTKVSLSRELREEKYMEPWLPLFRPPKSLKLQTPVRLKIPSHNLMNFTPFLQNARGEDLAGRTWGNSGTVTVLPTFENNDEAALFYLDHVYPLLDKSSARLSLEEYFKSPRELALYDEENQVSQKFTEFEGRYHEIKRQMAVERKARLDMINADETATWLLKYYREALEVPADPWVPLFKIVEALGNKLGGEAAGKTYLEDCNEEWNLLKRLTNESSRNTRHAVRPGETERPVTSDEIRESFEAAMKMILNYLWRLFQPPKAT